MNRIVSFSLVACLAAAGISTGGAHAQSATDAVDPAATPAVAPTAAPDVAPAVAPDVAPAVAPTAALTAAPTARPEWMPPMQPGKALVIIFRESRFAGSASGMKLFADDGVALTKLSNGRVIHAYFEPGDHILYSDKKKRDARIIGMEAGQVYFFEGRWEHNMMRTADVDLRPVDYEEGVRRVSGLKHPRPVGT